MYRKWFGLLIACVLLLAIFSPAAAQTYYFRLDQETVNVYVNTDGTLSIEYYLDFFNDPSASPIDYVDIGLPNSNYSLGNVTADVNGQAITDIQTSEYVEPGVALGLGAKAIPPGSSGRVHVTIQQVKKVLYPSTAEGVKDYASIEFSPNWFGSEYVYGDTALTATLILPPGIQPEEPRYHLPRGGWPGPDEPQSGYDDQGRVYYRWQNQQANASTQYTFGASFPDRLVPADSIVRKPLFELDFETLCCAGIFIAGAISVGTTIYQATIGARKRKMQYLPPKIAIEGHGIKRGLTAVEAAILMEQPMDKVLTMILFSVIKKSAARVTRREPLELEPLEPQPEGLQPYEVSFLRAFKDKNEGQRKSELQDMVIALVRNVAEKMKGFSRAETVQYYENIIAQAWKQVEGAQTPEVKSTVFDQTMDWTLLDRDFDTHSHRAFGSGPVILPNWWGHYDPTFHPATSGGGAASIGGGGISLPHLPGADFAASVVNSIESFSSGVIGDLTSFTGGVTAKTNPPPPPSSSSGGSRGGGGGGRSCACACACAGCACACAGGGR